eukprot:6129752-Amphidinium_carterae.1
MKIHTNFSSCLLQRAQIVVQVVVHTVLHILCSLSSCLPVRDLTAQNVAGRSMRAAIEGISYNSWSCKLVSAAISTSGMGSSDSVRLFA